MHVTENYEVVSGLLPLTVLLLSPPRYYVIIIRIMWLTDVPWVQGNAGTEDE